MPTANFSWQCHLLELPIVPWQEAEQPIQGQAVNSPENFIDEQIPPNILIDLSNQKDNNDVEPQNQENLQIGFVMIEMILVVLLSLKSTTVLLHPFFWRKPSI